MHPKVTIALNAVDPLLLSLQTAGLASVGKRGHMGAY
jgi:hypothetical protein